MGAIQNAMNQMTGTIAGAAAAAKHVSNQKKELELKNIENEQALENMQTDLLKNSRDIITNAGEKGLNALAAAKRESGGDMEAAATAAANKLMNDSYKEVKDNYLGVLEHKMLNEKAGKPIGQLNKSLEKMKIALDEKENEITARKKLMQNIELQKRKVGIK